jgi:penicillin-insensitive murein endopeptidase
MPPPRSRVAAGAAAAALALALGGFGAGCARAPSPLTPHFDGSIGMPHLGVLSNGEELPRDAPGIRWLRGNDRHWGAPRFVATLERAADRVAKERPGPPLVIGDLSARHGGHLTEHMSHRTGHDVDLLLFVTTLGGAPVPSPGFVRFDADGLAWDEGHKRFLRFDVERTWLLVRALVEDEEARVVWVFVSQPLQGLLVEWARARGEPGETVLRAERAMLQPGPPAETHDDHLHVRVGCDADEVAHGCEPTGPARHWHAPLAIPGAGDGDGDGDEAKDSDASIALELLVPIDAMDEDPSGPAATRRSGLVP